MHAVKELKTRKVRKGKARRITRTLNLPILEIREPELKMIHVDASSIRFQMIAYFYDSNNRIKTA